MRALQLAIVTLLAVLAASAQLPSRPPNPPGMQPPPPPETKPAACPVPILSAQLLDGAGRAIAADVDLEQQAKRLIVDAENASGKSIQGLLLVAKLTAFNSVRGAAPSSRTVRERWVGVLMTGRQISLQWTLTPEAHELKLSALWFEKVQFADGSSWQHHSGDGCGYTVQGRMLRPAKR